MKSWRLQIAVVVVLLALMGVAWYQIAGWPDIGGKTHGIWWSAFRQPSPRVVTPSPTGPRRAGEAPQNTPGPATSGQTIVATASRKLYRNDEYDFSFTYPSVLGDVVVSTSRADSVPSPTPCQSQGVRLTGSFKKNAHVDFGFVSAGYKECDGRGRSLLDITGLEIKDKSIKLWRWWSTEPLVLPIATVVPTATPGLVAYIIKNTVEEGSSGEPVAIIKSPISKIGALVFRTKNLSYADALALLEEIIAK